MFMGAFSWPQSTIHNQLAAELNRFLAQHMGHLGPVIGRYYVARIRDEQRLPRLLAMLDDDRAGGPPKWGLPRPAIRIADGPNVRSDDMHHPTHHQREAGSEARALSSGTIFNGEAEEGKNAWELNQCEG